MSRVDNVAIKTILILIWPLLIVVMPLFVVILMLACWPLIPFYRLSTSADGRLEIKFPGNSA